MRRVQESNLLGLSPTSFQDSRITVLPTLHLVICGDERIRTPDNLAAIRALQARPIVHSGTSPFIS